MNRMMKLCKADDGVPVMLAHFQFSLKEIFNNYLNACLFSAMSYPLLILCCHYLAIFSHVFALAPANADRRTAVVSFGLSRETDSVPDWPVEEE